MRQLRREFERLADHKKVALQRAEFDFVHLPQQIVVNTACAAMVNAKAANSATSGHALSWDARTIRTESRTVATNNVPLIVMQYSMHTACQHYSQ